MQIHEGQLVEQMFGDDLPVCHYHSYVCFVCYGFYVGQIVSYRQV